jgi:hypothetical protein
MTPSNAARVASALAEGDSRKDRLVGAIDGNNNPRRSQPQGHIQSWSDLDSLTEQLHVIAGWKADLQARIERAQLRFELLDADLDFSDLENEVVDFRRACSAIMWREAA